MYYAWRLERNDVIPATVTGSSSQNCDVPPVVSCCLLDSCQLKRCDVHALKLCLQTSDLGTIDAL